MDGARAPPRLGGFLGEHNRQTALEFANYLKRSALNVADRAEAALAFYMPPAAPLADAPMAVEI